MLPESEIAAIRGDNLGAVREVSDRLFGYDLESYAKDLKKEYKRELRKAILLLSLRGKRTWPLTLKEQSDMLVGKKT